MMRETSLVSIQEDYCARRFLYIPRIRIFIKLFLRAHGHEFSILKRNPAQIPVLHYRKEFRRVPEDMIRFAGCAAWAST